MAEVNLVGLGIFGIMFLVLLGIVSNTSEDSTTRIQRQMFLINCPEPSYDGQYNASNITIDGFTTLLGTNDANNPYLNNVTFGNLGTVFRCHIAPLTPGLAAQINTSNKDYQATTLGFPSGWFSFAGDFIGALFQRINQFFTLIGYFVLPTGFDIMGYGIGELSGYAIMFVVGIYALCYIFIGAMLYKIISPFAGAS